MKRNVNNYPLEILVVEDNENQRIDCVDRLRRKFPNAHIDEAGCRADATELILKAAAPGHPYDIAVIDLRLPDQTGGVESRDTSIPSMIVKTSGPAATRLIQWTAYPEDKSIKEFQDEHEVPQSGIVYEVISKRDKKWPRKMEEFIGRFVVEKTIGRWLDDPYFREMRNPSVIVISRRPGFARAPVDIPQFVLALIDVWPLLEPHRRLEALATFKGTDWELAEMDGGVRLTNKHTIEALDDARENARIFAEVMGSNRRGK